MTFDSAYYEDLQGRLRGLLIGLQDRFTHDQAAILDELINANEYGVALEMMTGILVEVDASIPNEQIEEIVRLAEQMSLSNVVRTARNMTKQ
jgi:hypothetical protein